MAFESLVLIISEGKCSADDVAKNVIKEYGNVEHKTREVELNGLDKTTGLILNLSNKYFSTEILLVPLKEDLNTVPLNLLKSVEAVLVYFDSKNKNFKNRIPNLNDFLTNNNIELGVLICESLPNDSKDGITYAEIKSEGKFLDIVEVAETSSNATESKGYSEICEIFDNFIWSNITKKETNLLPLQRQSSGSNTNSDSQIIDDELKMFENLLTEVLSFKNTSEILPREERLLYAEKIAKKFEPLLEDDFSDEGP